MKNKILQGLWIGLILVLLTTGIALASDSISVAVSATIPAVPGLNAPLQETTQENSTLQTVYSR